MNPGDNTEIPTTARAANEWICFVVLKVDLERDFLPLSWQNNFSTKDNVAD
jgi:hypothetical protein